jgi:hypothetical protein
VTRKRDCALSKGGYWYSLASQGTVKSLRHGPTGFCARRGKERFCASDMKNTLPTNQNTRHFFVLNSSLLESRMPRGFCIAFHIDFFLCSDKNSCFEKTGS